MTRWGLFQGYKVGSIIKKPVSAIHHVPRLTKKNDIIISIDAEKSI